MRWLDIASVFDGSTPYERSACGETISGEIPSSTTPTCETIPRIWLEDPACGGDNSQARMGIYPVYTACAYFCQSLRKPKKPRAPSRFSRSSASRRSSCVPLVRAEVTIVSMLGPQGYSIDQPRTSPSHNLLRHSSAMDGMRGDNCASCFTTSSSGSTHPACLSTFCSI